MAGCVLMDTSISHPFHQAANMRYLLGFHEPGAVALIGKHKFPSSLSPAGVQANQQAACP